VHRTGLLDIGEAAVFVGVTSAHRDASFQACRFIIDEIKTRLPIWKKETYQDGSADWVNCQHTHTESQNKSHNKSQPQSRNKAQESHSNAQAKLHKNSSQEIHSEAVSTTLWKDKPAAAPIQLIDSFGRAHTYLRISVTDRCNLRCLYCMPHEGMEWKKRDQLLTYEEITRLATIFTDMGIRKIRLTGGEPMVRNGLPTLIKELGEEFLS
jgi:uncharacterized radical SAM superfamily Fe-S cluster-containing enzyme